jgi:hypothetical protein
MDGSMNPRSGRGLPFLAMLLTLGVAMLWGAPSPAFPAECASPVVTVFTAGVIDGFAAGNEPTSPSAELQAFLPIPQRSFDQTDPNRGLIHTFTGLPTGIVGARLTVRLRADAVPGTDNDSLHLELLPGATFAWGLHVRTLTGVNPWVSPADRTVTLDLANLPASAQGVTDVLSALADGDLDVYLQDDTAADYLQLEVSHCPPSPPCIAPPWGMTGWWPLDEESGDQAAEVIRHADGVHVAGPIPVAGRVGGALSFDGVDDYVVVGEGSDPYDDLDIGTNDLTIDAWVRVESDVLIKPIVDNMDAAGTGAGYSLSLVAGNALTFAWGDASGLTFTHSTSGSPIGEATVPVGVWTHVAVTVDRHDPAGGRFYIDGELVNTFDPTTKPGSFANAVPLRIGAGGIFNNGFFDGAIDELEIFRRALGAEEVRALYEAGEAGKCKPSLHVDWDVPFCAGQSSAVIQPEVCNNSSVEQSYNVSFAPDDSCSVPGPTDFQVLPPAALPFLVPPRSCRTLPIGVGRPPGFSNNGEQACFFVTAESVATGEVVETRGSVWDQRDVCVICDRGGSTTDQPLGTSTPFTFDLRNTTAATRTVRWEAMSMAPEGAPEVVSLDGQLPGTSIEGEVTIPAGQRRQVTVNAEMTRFERLAQDLLFVDRDNDSVLASASLRSFSPGCTPTGTDLCLNNGRFRVTVAWRDFAGNTGLGRAVPLTSDTGYFWFFDPANVELVLKVLDGRALTDSFWVFYGALSTVEYVISVTDTETGVRKTYVNPSGNLASVADTEGLAVPVGASRAEEEEEEAPVALPKGPVFATTEACSPGTGNLCLNGSRFKIEVEWKDFNGNTGSGQAVPLTGDTGYFWFFNSANVELIVKVLDGRSLNDHWWVFYGALSNVEYLITVTDTATGNVKTYFNPSGTLASMADTSAFMD